jgi:hypothetical protein
MSKDNTSTSSDNGNTPCGAGLKRRDLLLSGSSLVAASALTAVGLTTAAQAQQQPAASAPASGGKRPNIVVIMGDDVGWFNIGAYHRGIMSGKTPNLDKLASEGMMFTDYYAEASCTAGRANFITGELPIRTGLTTVGQAGANVGIPPEAATLASALKEQGYATGQFGKNHLRISVPSRRNVGSVLVLIPGRSDLLQRQRPAQRDPQLCDRRGRSDRDAALGQSGQAADR